MPKPKDAWDSLSLPEQSEMMRVAVKNGITDLKTIREKYNEFAEGGNLLDGGGSLTPQQEAMRRLNMLLGMLNSTDASSPYDGVVSMLTGSSVQPFSIFGEGGGIHIKPENRGKFTRLKERTGHSATWFKEHGTPAQRKMATFALNSRHWNKHALGGNLFDGFSGPTQQMNIMAYRYSRKKQD